MSSGKDSRKLPRKSIQYYLAMYPRINGQVSSITLPSILASFFSLPCRSPARSAVGLDVQACLWHKGVKSNRTARTFPRLFPQSTDARAYEIDKGRKPAGFLPLYCVVWPSPWLAAELTWTFGRGEETFGVLPHSSHLIITLACGRADCSLGYRIRAHEHSYPISLTSPSPSYH